jgi:hypothetical protein
MEIINNQRNANLGILLTWCLYIAFALLTHWNDYGLAAKPEHHLRWTIIRLSTFSIWLFLAALLLRYRKQPVNWRSFSYSSIATIIIAKVFSSSLVSRSANDVIIPGAIVFYAMVSGFLCVSIKKPKIAAVLGLVLFVTQFFVDATAHIFSGVWRFQ